MNGAFGYRTECNAFTQTFIMSFCEERQPWVYYRNLDEFFDQWTTEFQKKGTWEHSAKMFPVQKCFNLNFKNKLSCIFNLNSILRVKLKKRLF